MESVPKDYRGQWRSFVVSHSWEAVSQEYEAATERQSRRVQHLTVQGREWSVFLVNCDWRQEDFIVISSASFCVEICC
jgi:hypothetical protein